MQFPVSGYGGVAGGGLLGNSTKLLKSLQLLGLYVLGKLHLPGGLLMKIFTLFHFTYTMHSLRTRFVTWNLPCERELRRTRNSAYSDKPARRVEASQSHQTYYIRYVIRYGFLGASKFVPTRRYSDRPFDFKNVVT